MSQPVLKASARVVSRLNRICPQVFPVSGLQPSEHRDQIMDTKVHLKVWYSIAYILAVDAFV